MLSIFKYSQKYMLGCLTPKEELVVRRFKEMALKHFSQEIVSFVLYGSKARGDFTQDSDIDLLVITQTDDWKLRHSLIDIGSDLSLKEELIPISIKSLSEKKLEYLRREGFSFAKNIDREGIAI